MGRVLDKEMLLGAALVVALLLCSATLNYRNTNQLIDESRLVARTLEVMEVTDAVLLTLVDAETGERGFLLTGKEDFLKPYHAAVKRYDKRMSSLKEMIHNNPMQKSRVDKLAELAAERLKLLQQAIQERRKFTDEAQAFTLTSNGKIWMDAVRVLISEIKQHETDLLHERQHQAQSAYHFAVTTTLTTTLVGLLLVAAFLGLLYRTLLARARATAAIHEQRQLLHTTLTSIGDAVIATDARGTVTFLNSIAQALTGFTQEEAAGKPLEQVFIIINEKTRQPAPNPALRAIADGRIVGLANHTVLLSRSGVKRPIEDSAAPIRDEDGTVSGAVLVFRDVTEKRRADDTLRAQLDQLAEADRRKDEFLATLAHELRNPLAPIRNALHIMGLNRTSAETLAEVRDIMERQVAQMVRLVDDLLDVSRITRGKINLISERVELAAVIASALETSRPLIEASRHGLTVQMPPQPLAVVGDLTRLAQVVSNLLNNSAKYTPEGGHIRLSVEGQDGQAVIRVRDDGMGIPAHVLPKIFEMFTQAERTLDRAQGGLGIGLTLVRRLVEMHGGKVEAHSAGTGQGSEFVVRLPLAPDNQAVKEAPKHESKAPAQHSPQRVLVVDDNQDSAESLGMLLRLRGNEVRTAYDGLAAIEAARAFHPEVVVLDIGLPGMNGYDVARQMRKMPELQGALLIAQTGWGQDEDRRRSEEVGFDAHLVKPVDAAALQDLLSRHVSHESDGKG
ncbi:MAG TPA: CHASE3 domain-containing protein [Gemmataceae bacterium]|nr:CHASE3 domain-containing protein [Gemmataceae bacterium]